MRILGALFRHPFFLLAVRIVIGGLFLATGIFKAIAPPEEFAAVIRTYQILPERALVPIATVLPWVEIVSGAFLALGLWTRWTAGVVGLMLLTFTLALGSAWARGIDLSDCGCFGGLGFKENGHEAFVRNLILLASLAPLLNARKTPYTLDRLLDRENSPEI